MTRVFFLAVLAIAGCASAAADHERLGDRAYREGNYAGAMAEYLAAAKTQNSGRLLAKLGNAALHTNDLATAISSFSDLAQSEPSRAAEAATGLERAAALAAKGGPSSVMYLAASVRALRLAAPGRPLGRAARGPLRGLEPTEVLAAVPAALASAASSSAVDSLLVQLGEAQRITTACEAAAATYSTALRRARDAGLRSTASQGLGSCALRLGLDALAGQAPDSAERWFDQAIGALPATPQGWRASVGKGDARLQQGDPLGAALAYQMVLSAAGVPDTLKQLAAEKLNALSTVPPQRETQ